MDDAELLAELDEVIVMLAGLRSQIGHRLRQYAHNVVSAVPTPAPGSAADKPAGPVAIPTPPGPAGP